MSAGTAHHGAPTDRRVLRPPPGSGSGVIGRCRDFVRETLAQWWPPAGDTGPRADDSRSRFVRDVVLMVSEVVTNACMHADGPAELLLDCTRDRLRIEVTDRSSAPPVMRRPDQALPGGHGLHVIESLSRAWGYERRGAGKAVWLEVDLPADIAR
ncbi:MAG TPA: ATP-binding protein [Actinocrinis sp.]|jgi:hypothetical protein